MIDHRRTVCCATLLALAAAASPLRAQPRDETKPIAPIEVLTCHFAQGKGEGDLAGLATAFNQWMEKYTAPEYAAYALLPSVRSKDIDFDLAWVGVWPDGITMGKSMAHYFDHGAELGPAFGSVMSCDTNTNFSTVTVRPPKQPGRFGPVEVTTCTVRLDASLDDALQAVHEWVDYTGTFGSTAAHWLLFPAYGERSAATYNFKWAIGYDSYEAFGREYDQITNGNGLDRYNELFTALLRCDNPRLYKVRQIRPPHG
ncbi:MAG TPA: hypothetical protein VE907_10515 [Gammaproteobacteria bacterium]|nr:hypothetical protein [Gammaproteobacteria bacterium]